MKTNNQIAIVTGLACAFFVAGASAQGNATDAVSETIACLEIADDTKRLECLDAGAKTLKSTRITFEEETVQNQEKERSHFGLSGSQGEDRADAGEFETPDEFGSEAIPEKRKERDNKRLKRLTAKIVEIKISPYDKVTLLLENGQIWRQLSADDHVLRFSRDGRLYTAVVKRSIMGNYLLTVKELKRTIRVRRIK